MPPIAARGERRVENGQNVALIPAYIPERARRSLPMWVGDVVVALVVCWVTWTADWYTVDTPYYVAHVIPSLSTMPTTLPKSP